MRPVRVRPYWILFFAALLFFSVTPSLTGGEVALPPPEGSCAASAEVLCQEWLLVQDGTSHDRDAAAAVVMDPSGTRAYISATLRNEGTGADTVTTAVDPRSGALLWSQVNDAARSVAMVVSPDGRILYVTGAVTIAYEAATGRPLWQGPPADLLEVTADSSKVVAVYTSTNVSKIDFRVLDARTGTPIWVKGGAAMGLADYADYMVDDVQFAMDDSVLVAAGEAMTYCGVGPQRTGYQWSWYAVAWKVATGERLWDYEAPFASYDCGGVANDNGYMEVHVATEGARVILASSIAPLDGSRGVDYAAVSLDGASGAPQWFSSFNDPEAPAGSRDLLGGTTAADGRLFLAGMSQDVATFSLNLVTWALNVEDGSTLWVDHGGEAAAGGPGGSLWQVQVEEAGGHLFLAYRAPLAPSTPGGDEPEYGFRTRLVQAGTGESVIAVNLPNPAGDGKPNGMAAHPSGLRIILTGTTGPLGSVTNDVWTVSYSLDRSAPRIVAPARMDLPAAASNDGSRLTYSVAAYDDLDPQPSLSCSPSPGTMFPRGDTVVRCVARDSSGNGVEHEFVASVHAPPSLVLPADIAASTPKESVAVDYEAYGIDDAGRHLEPDCWPSTGSLFRVGQTTVSCNVHDAYGGATEGSFVVTVSTIPTSPEEPAAPPAPEEGGPDASAPDPPPPAPDDVGSGTSIPDPVSGGAVEAPPEALGQDHGASSSVGHAAEPRDPRAVQVALATGAVLLASLYFVVPTAWRYGHLLVTRLFTLLRRDRLLEHPLRERLVLEIQAHPGIHFSGLGDRLGRGRGVLRHHLNILRSAQLIREVRAGGTVCFFPSGAVDATAAVASAALKSRRARAVLRTAVARPGLTISEVAAATASSYGTVAYATGRLSRAGLLTTSSSSRGALVYPTPRAAAVMAQLGEGSAGTRAGPSPQQEGSGPAQPA